VDGVILGAQCRRIHALGERLCLGRGAVLIRTTDINGWETPRPAKAGKNVGRLRGLVSDSKYAAQVAQSRRNRDAWRGRCGGCESRNYQNTADDVAEMRNVVDVWQRAGNENILLSRRRKRRLAGCAHLDCRVVVLFPG
jgi:hypothetical protein